MTKPSGKGEEKKVPSGDNQAQLMVVPSGGNQAQLRVVPRYHGSAVYRLRDCGIFATYSFSVLQTI